MLFTFEDALQIHHAKCEKIEVYKQETGKPGGSMGRFWRNGYLPY